MTGWCADYPDPENFADILFHSASPQNFGGFDSPELDALLEQARGEGDVVGRLALYGQIEQMLVDEAAAVFLSHPSVYYTLVRPYVRAHVSTPTRTKGRAGCRALSLSAGYRLRPTMSPACGCWMSRFRTAQSRRNASWPSWTTSAPRPPSPRPEAATSGLGSAA